MSICCGEILNFDISILKLETNERYIKRTSKIIITREIIDEYIELTSYKKVEESIHFYLKEINSFPKEYRQNKLSSKGLF
jgi:hypothetical protein